MKHALSTLVCLFVFAVPATVPARAAEPPKRLTIETICDGSLSEPAPSQLRWSPDGKLTFLVNREDGDGRDLWILDPASGEKQVLVSAEELARMAPSPEQAGVDERERTRRTRFGVAAYLWSPGGDLLLFTAAGQIWIYAPGDPSPRLLARSKTGVLDPKFSPDGRLISFVYEHDIWVVPIDGGPERQLTTGGHELLLHGDLDWVYPEEFRVRTGYEWAPDSRHLLFLEMDESPVPTYPITDQLGWASTYDLQRYPRAGDPNPKVRIGFVNVETARTAWLDRAAEYIPRFGWATGELAAIQLMNRGQDELELVLADPATGRSRSVLMERDEHWIDLSTDLTFLDGGKRFLWTSQRTGLRHIYLYESDGTLVRPLTSGDFRVAQIDGVDESAGHVYFTSNEDNVIGADLYRVKLDGGKRERLTKGKGTHRIDLSPTTRAWVDSFSSLKIDEPRVRALQDRTSGRSTEISRDPDLTEYGLVQPEMVELKAPDGGLVRMLILKPAQLEKGRRYPLVVYAYGMAGFPTIRDSWSNGRRDLFHQFLVQQGYVVAQIDDRSSSIPGHKYAIQADLDIGPTAAKDHRVAVEHLRSLSYVQAEPIALWGWSGGGFTTTFHLGHTDLFQVGIAGAPVTDWRLYDSIYTERYMGLPQDNPEAYDRTSSIEGAANVTGRLLLIHGTHDDNVHPQNTLKMMDALIREKKQFDLMMYPNKTHGISGTAHNIHLHTMIFDYLERWVKQAPTP